MISLGLVVRSSCVASCWVCHTESGRAGAADEPRSKVAALTPLLAPRECDAECL